MQTTFIQPANQLMRSTATDYPLHLYWVTSLWDYQTVIDQVLTKVLSAAPDSNPGAELEQPVLGYSRALWTGEKVACLICIIRVQ